MSPQPGADLIIQAFFLPGGPQIAAYVWGTENTLIVLDATNGKLVRKIDLGEEFHKDLAVSADGRWFLTGNGGDRSVRLRDLTTGKEAARCELADVNVPRAVGFSPDGIYAVAGSHGDGSISGRSRNDIGRDASESLSARPGGRAIQAQMIHSSRASNMTLAAGVRRRFGWHAHVLVGMERRRELGRLSTGTGPTLCLGTPFPRGRGHATQFTIPEVKIDALRDWQPSVEQR